MLTSNQIKKYNKKSVPKLLALAQKHFNRFIRERDSERGCVSCNTGQVQHASHYYSAGNYSVHRFSEFNVHGSCAKCNTFLHGNLLEYRIVERIGKEKFEWLKGTRHAKIKWERISLISLIEKYK